VYSEDGELKTYIVREGQNLTLPENKTPYPEHKLTILAEAKEPKQDFLTDDHKN
jgi:hypothetical protein